MLRTRLFGELRVELDGRPADLESADPVAPGLAGTAPGLHPRKPGRVPVCWDVLYYMLERGVPYQHLGDDYFHRRQAEHAERYKTASCVSSSASGMRSPFEPLPEAT